MIVVCKLSLHERGEHWLRQSLVLLQAHNCIIKLLEKVNLSTVSSLFLLQYFSPECKQKTKILDQKKT
jgi:hypothetical protein